MSWSIEEHIGDCRPFPAQVVIYRGETDECLAYVSGEVADRLKAENARLRELVRDYEHCSTHASCDRCEYDGTTSTHCPLSPCFPDIDELQELGIEVDE